MLAVGFLVACLLTVTCAFDGEVTSRQSRSSLQGSNDDDMLTTRLRAPPEFPAPVPPLTAHRTASSSLEDRAAEHEKLKAEIHKLPPAEAELRFRRLVRLPTPPRQEKVDHFVVLYMENHAADAFFGCMDLPGFDGIREGHSIPVDPDDPSKGVVNVTCGDAPYVCSGGPGYNAFSSKFRSGANANTYPYDEQSDRFSYANGGHDTSIQMFSPDQIPIKAALAKEYGVFNALHTAVPSFSTPNHLFTQSATSCGIIDNIIYSDCGGATDTFPQFTMYDNLYLSNVSFAVSHGPESLFAQAPTLIIYCLALSLYPHIVQYWAAGATPAFHTFRRTRNPQFYMNSTCGLFNKTTGKINAPCHGMDPHSPDAGSPIPTPDVAMDGVRRYKAFYHSQEHFYEAAAAGTLPQLSWVMPPSQACDHPCNDIAKGERILKDVYEALVASPKWNKTVFFVAYDDAGGFYDHVVPPSEGVPSDDAPCHVLDQCPGHNKFDFRRLGLRTTAMLISPLVARGSVFQKPKGPFNTSQFDLASVTSTVKNFFNLSTFLTKRDAWSGSFDELLLDKPRETPLLHLPEAPAPAQPWDPPFPPTQGPDIVDEAVADAPKPQHCSAKDGICRGPDALTAKQRRHLRLYARLLQTPEPNADEMTSADAREWLALAWDRLMELDMPIH